MTTDSGTPPTGPDASLALIDDILARPFPAGEESEDNGVRSSGPGHHLLILRAGKDFWDDRSTERAEESEEETEAEFSAVATALTERWGEPETVDLWPYLAQEDGPVAEPLGQLSNLAGSMQVWRPPSGEPDGGKWLGLTVGQADPEFPIWLLAAVGEAAALPG
ncbi:MULTISPECIES: hypothetical protein [unclassified Streptomyces]|uniref:hypothetical protein n=1 Tax=unclassified Streptomyces TaxID=2593676 RepID=UPI0001C1A2F0|nr:MULTISPECIES: hypothetical protein [unclassified Streptomyces]AEN10931.1 conserved hypothetical protein [Streptomyces sp. SirexAA-E]MYR69334.1 hypothetical protein [Streptomyces sp. SID4939]MYR99734.1 hypothetical protein [Streptomyces sp. SID4940]MYT63800.1 hypothetical protein [Streptomyces sp. SID8357]MYT86050.1 hypothetical protein [Streptomyces sp. SID8360]